MNTDTMIELGTEQYGRYLKEGAQERMNGQAAISRPSFIVEAQNQLGAILIHLGARLQHTTVQHGLPTQRSQQSRGTASPASDAPA